MTANQGIGGNNPPPFESLSLRMDELLSGARTVLTEHSGIITDKAVGEKLAGFKKQLDDLLKKAEVEHKAEKEPHLEACKQVDSKWKVISDKIGLAINFIAPKLTAHLNFLNEERRKEEAAVREKQRLAQEEADRKTREAAELAKKAEAGELKGSKVDPIQAKLDADAAQEAANALQKDAKALQGNATIGSGYTVGGKARSIATRTFYHAKIEKPLVALAFFHDNQRLIDTLQAIANEYVRATSNPEHEPPPGCSVYTETKAV